MGSPKTKGRTTRHTDVTVSTSRAAFACGLCDTVRQGSEAVETLFGPLDQRGPSRKRIVYVMPSLNERFWSKVRRTDANSCWNWTAGLSKDGYGKLSIGRENTGARAHRVAWAITFGPIPTGLHVLHRCDNPKCCNPRHLFLGTNDDNVRDRNLKGRHRTCGPRGASFNARRKLTEANVRAIRARLEAGDEPKAIAPEFGVTQQNIIAIKNRRTWVYLT